MKGRNGGAWQIYNIQTSKNRLIGNNDIVYNGAGHMLEVGPYSGGHPRYEMEYDPYGMQTRFVSRETSTPVEHLYLYGPNDRRLVTYNTATGEREFKVRGLGDEVLREYSVTGWGSAINGQGGEGWAHVKDFLYGPEGVFATRTRAGNATYLHKDHLGTPRLLTDDDGDNVGRHDYYPFGLEIPRSGQADEPTKKYTGHEREPNGRADYMLGRTYLYPFMRFATPDPARDGWSLYAYTGNNPVNYVDPDGTIGVALNDAARAEILSMAGADANAVSFSEDGTFTVSASQEQLESNTGLQLLHNIATNEKRIGFVVGDSVQSSQGSIILGPSNSIQNLSTTPDNRPGTQILPPGEFDGMVGIYPDFAANRSENVGAPNAPKAGSRPISLGPISFHELAENFYKTVQGEQYIDAHRRAIDAESRLRAERPELNTYAFGGGPYIRRQID